MSTKNKPSVKKQAPSKKVSAKKSVAVKRSAKIKLPVKKTTSKKKATKLKRAKTAPKVKAPATFANAFEQVSTELLKVGVDIGPIKPTEEVRDIWEEVELSDCDVEMVDAAIKASSASVVGLDENTLEGYDIDAAMKNDFLCDMKAPVVVSRAKYPVRRNVDGLADEEVEVRCQTVKSEKLEIEIPDQYTKEKFVDLLFKAANKLGAEHITNSNDPVNMSHKDVLAALPDLLKGPREGAISRGNSGSISRCNYSVASEGVAGGKDRVATPQRPSYRTSFSPKQPFEAASIHKPSAVELEMTKYGFNDVDAGDVVKSEDLPSKLKYQMRLARANDLCLMLNRKHLIPRGIDNWNNTLDKIMRLDEKALTIYEESVAAAPRQEDIVEVNEHSIITSIELDDAIKAALSINGAKLPNYETPRKSWFGRLINAISSFFRSDVDAR